MLKKKWCQAFWVAKKDESEKWTYRSTLLMTNSTGAEASQIQIYRSSNSLYCTYRTQFIVIIIPNVCNTINERLSQTEAAVLTVSDSTGQTHDDCSYSFVFHIFFSCLLFLISYKPKSKIWLWDWGFIMMLTKHETKHLLYKHNITAAELNGRPVMVWLCFSRIRVQIDRRELAFEFLPFAVFRWRRLGVYRRSSELFTFCFLHFFFNGLNINFVFCGCYKEENNKYYIMSSHAYTYTYIWIIYTI